MSAVDVIDAWTDLEVRAGLTELELNALPAHPAGDPDQELAELPGGLVGSDPTVSLYDTTVLQYEPPHWT